jgi:multidrug transporter EmrE-like cation transporter
MATIQKRFIIARELGVVAGRVFLSLGIITTILAGIVVLGEKLALREWIVLIIAGMLLVRG